MMIRFTFCKHGNHLSVKAESLKLRLILVCRSFCMMAQRLLNGVNALGRRQSSLKHLDSLNTVPEVVFNAQLTKTSRLSVSLEIYGAKLNSLSYFKLKVCVDFKHCSFGNEPGELGSGEGKGGGSGGAVRSAGGVFGRMEVAREEEYFYKQQKKQLAMLRKTLDDEVASHKKHIEIHQDAIERHRQKIAELVKEERKLETFEKITGAVLCKETALAHVYGYRHCSTAKVNIIGSNVPPPAQTFSEIPFNDVIAENFSRLGYKHPTDVQQYAIPVLLARRDLMACSGKTIAFLAPIFHHVLETAAKENITKQQGSMMEDIQCHPSALVMAPTRELTRQIYEESIRMGRNCAIRTAILHGGSENYRYQLNMLRSGGDVIIATPGRLNDLIRQNIVSLKRCRYLVLDEADRMLDMGFEPQIRQIIQHSGLPAIQDRQTSMFSATFPSEIRQLACEFMKPDYAYISIGATGTIPKSIKQELMWVVENEKPDVLVKLLDEESNVRKLVFVETKLKANSLTELLNRKTKHRAVTVHGNLSQRMRERNLSLFREGRINTLIATSVAARGLDIPNVKHVINYDLPSNIDDYVHRIGRTGRMGNQGLATSLCNEMNANIFQDLRRVLKETGHQVPDFLNNTYRKVAADRPKRRASKFTWNDRHFKRASDSFTINAINFA
ncbi:hypothetical protein M514_11539 [Trichuris suis]|uniref:RNA helicase n=1 Tax=Trichuris suis TaxID=68888 RepID=A0A085N679_9BILA|nr:hypothetical protein M513_11539 [Trichuris suis]KFD64975.1 hypothetical protein M514_11539 [Trichuris suis]